MTRHPLSIKLALLLSLAASSVMAAPYPGDFNYRVPIGGAWRELAPGLVRSPRAVTFTETGVGTSSLAEVTLTNVDTVEQPLALSALLAPFSMISTTCGEWLDATESCVVSLAYTPLASGPAAGTLTLSWGAQSSSVAVPLSGSTPPPAAGLVPLGGPGTWVPVFATMFEANGSFLGLDSTGKAYLKDVTVSPCLEVSVYPSAGASLSTPESCIDLTDAHSSSSTRLWGNYILTYDNANNVNVKVDITSRIRTVLPNMELLRAEPRRYFGTTLLRAVSDTDWLYSPETDQLVSSTAWAETLNATLNGQQPAWTPMAYDDASQTVVGYQEVPGGIQVFRARLGEKATAVFVPVTPDTLSYYPDPVILPNTDGQLILIATEDAGVVKVQSITGEYLIDNPDLNAGSWSHSYSLFSGSGQPFGYQRWNAPGTGSTPFILRRLP